MPDQTRLRYRTMVAASGRDVILRDREQVVAYGYDQRDGQFVALILTEREDEAVDA